MLHLMPVPKSFIGQDGFLGNLSHRFNCFMPSGCSSCKWPILNKIILESCLWTLRLCYFCTLIRGFMFAGATSISVYSVASFIQCSITFSRLSLLAKCSAFLTTNGEVTHFIPSSSTLEMFLNGLSLEWGIPSFVQITACQLTWLKKVN